MSRVPSAFMCAVVEVDDMVAICFFECIGAAEPIIPVCDVVVCVVLAGVCDIFVVVIFDELLVFIAPVLVAGAGVAAGAVWAWAADPPSRPRESKKPRRRFIKKEK